MLKTERIVLFYTHEDVFSNMHRCSFEANGFRFGSVEQGYMICKAGAFDDREIISRLVEEQDPYRCKRLGRMVAGFDSAKWNEQKERVMMTLCQAKFEQNDELRRTLLETGDRQLGEASPTDFEWGIGLAIDNPLAIEPRNWKGKNLLGKTLMEVRRLLASA